MKVCIFCDIVMFSVYGHFMGGLLLLYFKSAVVLGGSTLYLKGFRKSEFNVFLPTVLNLRLAFAS